MKKIIAITLILLIGLLVLGGCGSKTVDTSTNKGENQQNTEPEQQPAENDNIPQPPALPEG